MVVFTCGYCGESVQKPKVEKHYLMKCRNRSPNLSCMDCFIDFHGNDFETHSKCITEAERYSRKGFMAKAKKGEKKQSTWVEMVQSVLDEQKNAPRNVLRIVETVSKHNNTPRKKPKFINFVKNVCGHKTNPNDIDQAWDMISVKLTALSNVNAQNRNRNVKGDQSQTNSSEEDNLKEEAEDLNSVTEDENSQNGDLKNNENDMVNNQNELGNNQNRELEGNKKLSKKQRKEEKKRQKYETALQSAAELPDGEETEEVETKKGKKKKNKSESSNGDVEETQTEGKNKNKRKRQDTANSVPELTENIKENVENEPGAKPKPKKNKKVGEQEEAEESLCLHDQNVAKIEELSMQSEKFNWHAVIMSVLEKKGEVQFKRLQKKVLSEYSEATGRDVDDRIADKFIKKLKSCPNVRVDKNRVLIID